MSGNRWRLPSQSSRQLPQIEYLPFICCWCRHSFMDIEALIQHHETHHETHLTLLQNQVQSIYSSTLLRPRRAMNPLRSLLSLPDTSAINTSADLQPAVQFFLPNHQSTAGSSPASPCLPFLRGSNGFRQLYTQSHPQGGHQRGTDDRRPSNALSSRQQVMRPPQQKMQQGPIEGQPSKAPNGQHKTQVPPSIDETLDQNMGASNLIEGFVRPEPEAIDQHEENNETLDLTLSLGGPYQ